MPAQWKNYERSSVLLCSNVAYLDLTSILVVKQSPVRTHCDRPTIFACHPLRPAHFKRTFPPQHWANRGFPRMASQTHRQNTSVNTFGTMQSMYHVCLNAFGSVNQLLSCRRCSSAQLLQSLPPIQLFDIVSTWCHTLWYARVLAVYVWISRDLSCIEPFESQKTRSKNQHRKH
jgi:hypothetical protein